MSVIKFLFNGYGCGQLTQAPGFRSCTNFNVERTISASRWLSVHARAWAGKKRVRLHVRFFTLVFTPFVADRSVFELSVHLRPALQTWAIVRVRHYVTIRVSPHWFSEWSRIIAEVDSALNYSTADLKPVMWTLSWVREDRWGVQPKWALDTGSYLVG